MLGPLGDAGIVTIGIFLLLTAGGYCWYPWCVRFWRHRQRQLAEAARELEEEKQRELEEDRRVRNLVETLPERLERKRLEGKERGRLR